MREEKWILKLNYTTSDCSTWNHFSWSHHYYYYRALFERFLSKISLSKIQKRYISDSRSSIEFVALWKAPRQRTIFLFNTNERSRKKIVDVETRNCNENSQLWRIYIVFYVGSDRSLHVTDVHFYVRTTGHLYQEHFLWVPRRLGERFL